MTGFCLVYIISFLMLCSSWLTPATRGDLTRIGGLSEYTYSARHQQPLESASNLVSVALNKADVLVVGDSFSTSSDGQQRTGLAWQARLVADGMSVATLHWDDVRPICPDFDSWLRRAGFKGHTVILQSVERNAAARLIGNARCQLPRQPGDSAYVTSPFDSSRTEPVALNWQANLMHGATTWFNTQRAGRATVPITLKAPHADEAVRIVPMVDGCLWFSHLQCDRGIFLAADMQARPLSADLVEVMHKLSSEPSPWRKLWVIVPDKSTFYSVRPMAAEAASTHFAMLAQEGLGPDLYAALEEMREKRTDIYLPNDSHLSPAGYQQMGRVVRAWMTDR